MEQKKEIRIVNKPLALATDGNGIMIKSDDQAEVMFFQITNETKEHIDAVVTGVFRMTLGQLKALEDSIKNTITQHEKSKTK